MTATTEKETKRIVVDVADDRLTASIRLKAVADKEPVTAEEVLEALKGAKIAVGDPVKERVAEFVDLAIGDKPTAEAFVVAKGQPAEEGKDEELIWDETFETQKADWQGDAPVNYYELSSIVTIEKDKVIGTISALVPTRNGVDVHGRVIKPGRTPERLELADTVGRSAENPSQLIANTPGRVVQVGRKLSIEVVTIKGDVSFETGNIDSTTNVHVMGSIPDRFEVKSAKSISVDGTIEAAVVEAEGDIVVRGGIVGRHAGRVSAGGRIITKFCAEANLNAQEDVKIGNQVLNSAVRTQGLALAQGSTVIGGHLYARAGIDVGALGSESDTPTRIFVGINPDVLVECGAIDERLQLARDAIKSTRERLQPFLDNLKRLTPSQREQATELMYKADEAVERVATEEKRRDQLLQDALGDIKPRVRVSDVIRPRVTISIGRRTVTFQKELKGPIAIEEQQINNVTEMVAVNQLTGSIQVLKSQRLAIEDLQRDFEPLHAPTDEGEEKTDSDSE